MKKCFFLFLIAILPLVCRAKPIIIDHNSCNSDEIPSGWLNSHAGLLRIAYGHTSHGSQLMTGLNALKSALPALKTINDISYYRSGSSRKAAGDEISIWDYYPSGDLGNPDRTSWADATRKMLQGGGNEFGHTAPDRNVIMWSWCGQVSSATENDIKIYLALMDSLERDFPDVRFVYFTGHLDGSGRSGNLNIRNEQIRQFCRDKDKILFDFADIESFGPDGNSYLERSANDNCDYNGGNWAAEWCEKHPDDCTLCSAASECAHSQCLNCLRKGGAFMRLMAILSGWDETVGVREETGESVRVAFADKDSELQKLITRCSCPRAEIYNLNGQRVADLDLSGGVPAVCEIIRNRFQGGVYYIQALCGSEIAGRMLFFVY